jgi:hypothetical protein
LSKDPPPPHTHTHTHTHNTHQLPTRPSNTPIATRPVTGGRNSRGKIEEECFKLSVLLISACSTAGHSAMTWSAALTCVVAAALALEAACTKLNVVMIAVDGELWRAWQTCTHQRQNNLTQHHCTTLSHAAHRRRSSDDVSLWCAEVGATAAKAAAEDLESLSLVQL